MTQASARLTEERLASNTLVKREKHPVRTSLRPFDRPHEEGALGYASLSEA